MSAAVHDPLLEGVDWGRVDAHVRRIFTKCGFRGAELEALCEDVTRHRGDLSGGGDTPTGARPAGPGNSSAGGEGGVA